ncbi:MAG: hypothetical protein ACQGVK_17535 [Myxococcota bacterium]
MDSGRAADEGRLRSGEAPARTRLETRDLLLLCIFATFLVIARVALRWHLHLPGHSMAPAALLLVLSRVCVPRFGAASLVGFMAGLVGTILGLGGRSGPLLVLKLGLAGVAVDVAARFAPSLFRGGRERAWWSGAWLGALCGATDFVPVAILESLAGLPPTVVLAHAALSAGAKMAWGAAGGAAAGIIAERLRHHGLVEAP